MYVRKLFFSSWCKFTISTDVLCWPQLTSTCNMHKNAMHLASIGTTRILQNTNICKMEVVHTSRNIQAAVKIRKTARLLGEKRNLYTNVV
jgi:hypothetical protein